MITTLWPIESIHQAGFLCSSPCKWLKYQDFKPGQILAITYHFLSRLTERLHCAINTTQQYASPQTPHPKRSTRSGRVNHRENTLLVQITKQQWRGVAFLPIMRAKMNSLCGWATNERCCRAAARTPAYAGRWPCLGIVAFAVTVVR